MKRLSLLLAGLLLVCGIVFADSEEDVSYKGNMEIFGFTVNVPSGWQINPTKMEDSDEITEFWMTIPAGDAYVICYFKPLAGDYDEVKKDIPANFRIENFKSFDEMYGADSLTIKVFKKPVCAKVNGIEVCSAEFNYDYMQSMDQHTYFAVFKTAKGAYQAFFSADPKTYKKLVDTFKKKVVGSLKLVK